MIENVKCALDSNVSVGEKDIEFYKSITMLEMCIDEILIFIYIEIS